MMNANMKILIVDDFATIRTLIRTQLMKMGFKTIVEATNGQDALEILNKGRMGLVISDWNMPRMNGYELLKAIRSDLRLKKTPFIMVTAEASQENICMVMQLNVDQLIIKPFSLDVLEQKINMVIH